MKFKDIKAQKRAADYLYRVSKSRRLSHAYIIEGERGMGKRTLANVFATALLCEKRFEEDFDGPCGHCRSCRMAATENHPDIMYVTRLGKTKSLSVDDIRAQLIATVDLRPYQSEYRIFIVDDADTMTLQAQNALLKSLEEPPEFVIFILLASNAGNLIETIRSRCVTLNLAATPDDIVREIVIEKSTIPDYRIDAVTAFAQGNVGKALTLAESDSFEDLKNTAFGLMGKLDKMTDTELIELADSITDVEELLDLLLIYVKDVLVYKATDMRECLVLKDQAYHICSFSDSITDFGAGRLPEVIADARDKIAAKGQKKLVLSNLFFRLKEIRINKI